MEELSILETLGLQRRRDNPIAYSREWSRRHREYLNKYHRDYHHNVIKTNPDKLAAKNLSGSYTRRKKKYGITKNEYLTLLTKQNGRCSICDIEYGDKLRVDYNHLTGKVRSLLCANCNAGLGMFQEYPDRLKSAASYIEQHNIGV